MIVKLAFGDGSCTVDLRGLKVRSLAPRAPPGLADPGPLVAAALARPVEGPPLEAVAARRASAAVVVPDATRAVQLPAVLPPILRRLTAAGIPSSEITVLVACGTHPPVGEDEIRDLVGPLPPGVRLAQHDSRDSTALVGVGELEPGVPVRLHRAVVDSELLVTVGSVRHHYFAGFGGGPKMVFPGVAGHREIQLNHSRVLRRSETGWQRHPGCEPGNMRGNPVAEEIARAANLRPPDCAVCLVAGSSGRVAWVTAGPWRPAHAAAIEQTRAWYEVAGGGYRLAVACAGGHPSDASLIQAHKALDAASRFVEEGGEILLVAALGAGAGSPAMEPFLADPAPQAILERLAKNWVQYGHTTLRLVEKTSRFRVHLVSQLEPSLAKRLGFRPIADPKSVVDAWRSSHPGETVAVMRGAAVYPKPC